MVEVVVEQCSDKVVCRGDCVEVACEVEVDILRRQYLCITATCSTTLHTEARAERRLAQGDDSLLANVVKTHTEADAHCGLSYTCLCCGDSRNEDEVALCHALLVDELVRNLCDILTIVKYIIIGQTDAGCYFADILELRLASNFDIRFHFVGHIRALVSRTLVSISCLVVYLKTEHRPAVTLDGGDISFHLAPIVP